MFKGLTITARGQMVLNLIMLVAVTPAILAVGALVGLMFVGVYDLGTVVQHLYR